jgi:sulfite exporter TauE/SafE
MSGFSYYLHEKAEESRHNESMGLLVATIGSVFLVGGLLQTIGTIQALQFNQFWSSSYGFLGFSFTILGIMLLLVGLTLAVHYASLRSWYGNALKEKYGLEEEELRTQKKSEGKKSELFQTEVAEAVSPVERVRTRKNLDHAEP